MQEEFVEPATTQEKLVGATIVTLFVLIIYGIGQCCEGYCARRKKAEDKRREDMQLVLSDCLNPPHPYYRYNDGLCKHYVTLKGKNLGCLDKWDILRLYEQHNVSVTDPHLLFERSSNCCQGFCMMWK